LIRWTFYLGFEDTSAVVAMVLTWSVFILTSRLTISAVPFLSIARNNSCGPATFVI
jgi:hypothetical protein